MRLKKLELHGFKSFADKTEIVFNQGITGIVGPNGSGKSNIGDAVRWVLGEQSARVLRGAKMEDIIFNGTAKRKPASFCEVSLVFDNEDGALKSSFAEVMVTRRVYRNGDSEYYLNKTGCRLKDILELFRDTGIGREGYSLIGQGRIDEILSVKSEDRRQIFEEAAGVMTFRVRKEEAERKLARTKDNLSRVNDILSELEQHLGPLENQSKVAREFLVLSERLKTLEINVFLIRHDKLKERITQLTSAMEGLRDILTCRENELKLNTAEREELEEALSELDISLKEAREEHLACSDELHAVQGECTRVRGLMDANTERLEHFAREREENLRRKAQLEAADTQSAQDTQRSRDILREAGEAVASEQEKLDRLTREADEKEQALEAHKARILEAINRQSDVRNHQTRQTAILTQMRERMSELESSVQEEKEKQVLLENALAEAQKKADDTQQSLLDLKRDAAEIEGKLRDITQVGLETQEKMQSLNTECQSETSRLRLMEDMAREMDGYSLAVKKALAFGAENKKVHGAVARLIQVPQEYETAIDMVLGAALQNIVTEDEQTAKQLIDYLRSNKLGRATFLPMNAVTSRVLTRDERRVLSMPGCLGVASELITFLPQYRGVMENLLGRTVIAESLDYGIPIMNAGRHAFRLVTLAGDVMHPGGSMTGGTAAKSTVSLLGREREMKQLQEKLVKDRAELDAVRERLMKLRDERDELKRIRGEATERVHQEEIALARDQEHVFNARTEASAARARLERTDEAIRQLRDNAAEIEEDLKQVREESRTGTEDRETLEAGTEALQRDFYYAREHVREYQDRVTALKLKYAELEHALDILNRDTQRRKNEIGEIDRALEKTRQQDLESRERENALKRQLAQLETEEESKRAQLRTLQDNVALLEEKRGNKAAAQRECMHKSDELHEQYDADSASLHKTELALDRAENDLRVMTEHIFNSYEMTYGDAAAFRQTPFDLTNSEREAASLRGKIRAMGTVNVSSIEEYAETKARYDDMTRQREDLDKAADDLQTLIDRLLVQMEKQFVSEFAKIGDYFKETFARLFGGGQAELKLSDPDDALNCGIEIIAQPPGKKLQLLSLLSGGERALTAIAILFAMLKLKPTPFCILDEIEAALDEANIGYFADYLSEYAATTQFVVVTHRKGTMERCDSLYGVAMQERGISGMVSVNLQDYE